MSIWVRNPCTLRFSCASGEPPRADALWGLTDLLLPTEVYVCTGCSQPILKFATLTFIYISPFSLRINENRNRLLTSLGERRMATPTGIA